MEIKKFLKDNGDYIIFEGECLQIYIPEEFERKGLAVNEGDKYVFFGICNCQLIDAKGNPGKLETFNVPGMINSYPSEIETMTLSLVDGYEDKYSVLKFFKGDKLMRNVVQQDQTNMRRCVDMLTRGKIPRTIPYNQLLDIWLKNMEVNKVHLGVPGVILEIIIAELYRDPQKPELRFGRTVGSNPKMDQTKYRTANLREICARNSTFTALTFEDLDYMITTSLNINKYNKSETVSPIEQIMKM